MSSLKKALSLLRSPGSRSNTTSDAEDDTSVKSQENGSPDGIPMPNGNQSPRHARTWGPGSPRASGTFGKVDSSPRNSGAFRRDRVSSDTDHRTHHSRSPVRMLREKLRLDNESGDEIDQPLNREGEKLSKNQARKHNKQTEKEKRKMSVEEAEKKAAKQRADREERLRAEEPEEMKRRYGVTPTNSYAGAWTHAERMDLRDLSSKDIGKEITFRARIHNMRVLSAKLVFFIFRQQTITVQGLLHEANDISAHFVYWSEHMDIESIVLVKGRVQEPKAKQGEILATSIHDLEILVLEMHLEGKVSAHVPFTVHEAELSKVDTEKEGEKRQVVPERVRLNNRILDLRTTASQAIFRIQSGMVHLFREHLDGLGFMEVHTPKLQGGATESGATVFKVDYFGRPAFLAQSPQLAKQMCMSADFRKVYEVGPVFRAENSNTHRHMTEFTGLDLEMAIDEHYHEVLRTLDGTFKHIFKGLYERFRPEMEIVKRQFPHEDLVWLDETPRIPFADGIKMLNDSGWRDENGNPLPLDEDMGTRDEVQLGKLIKEKYKTDFYILDKFPASARPFYAMPDPDDPKITNSFDIFLRGQEILSGGQRIHDAQMLLKSMENAKIDRSVMEEYVQGFEWGAPPHGGGGIGMERMLFLLLNLGDIRHASLFPRDPKSLPEQKPIKQLRHPEASTMHPPWEGTDRATAGLDFQPIEKLIANYGDATNTSWLEPRTQIWRDDFTGAAVGWVPHDSYAIIVGDPLCHTSQYTKTISGFLRFIKKETNLKPLWLLVNAEVEETLAEKFNWRSFSVVAEQRVNPTNNPASHDTDLQRKIRHAEREGIKIVDIPIGTPVPSDVREKVDARVEDWLKNRKGKQVHLTNIRPWQDMEHRQYHHATTKDGTIAALVVLAQLSPDHGWQVKYSLDFPGAPGGTIEHLVLHSLKALAASGVTAATFGGGAMNQLVPGHNLKGAKVKMLAKAYHAIVTELKLTNKSEFRDKLGAYEEPVYICYPPHGLGPLGAKAILGFFED